MSTVKNEAPAYNRKWLIENMLNAGKKVQGLTGYVKTTVVCCAGNSVVFIPVTIIRIEMRDCEFNVIVKPSNEVVSSKQELQINPKDFFQSKEDAIEYTAFQKQVALFKASMGGMSRYNGSVMRCRNQLRVALAASNAEAYVNLANHLESEIKEEFGSVAKASQDAVIDAYRQLMLLKFFPNGAPGDSPEDNFDDDFEE